jgi:hypothetical protein
MSPRFFNSLSGRLFLIGLLLASCASSVSAAELHLEAKLIWGTDDEKSPDPNHKPVDAVTAEQFRKVFRWKYYFRGQ